MVERDLIGDEDRLAERLWYGEIVWWFKPHRKCHAYYVPEVLLIKYREHGAEHLSNLHTMLNHLPQLILINKVLHDQFGEEQRSLCPRAHGRRPAILGSYHIMNDERAEGRKACRESFKYYRWVACLGVSALSYVFSGEQIRRLASISRKVMDKLGVLRTMLR